jgi:hypothetical protein
MAVKEVAKMAGMKAAWKVPYLAGQKVVGTVS